MSFAEALILIGPLSRSRLYCAARTVFVSAPGQLAQFDRVFASVFGGCSDEPGERVRQAEEAQMR